QKFATINPAASVYRNTLIRQIKPAVQELKPDAIHLGCRCGLINDGKGLIEDQNFIQGAGALQRALLDAFPDIVLSADGMNEIFSPMNFFAQRRDFGTLAPHPICAFLFGDRILSYGHMDLSNPDKSPAQFLKSYSHTRSRESRL